MMHLSVRNDFLTVSVRNTPPFVKNYEGVRFYQADVFEQPNGPGSSGIKQRAWAGKIRGYFSMDVVSSICGNCNAQEIFAYCRASSV
jgi:hypothetical protein